MKFEKKLYLNIFWIVLGAVLVICGAADILDSYWSGMGGALVAVGGIHTVQQIKFRKNKEYREKIEIESKDERNKFIALNSWAWAGYVFVILNGFGSIGFKLAGNDMLSQYCAFTVCIVLLIYCVCYFVLRKKY